MFITKDVNIPREIFEALEDGKLVIFAGAGVSVDPPSDLPNFFKLAKQIGEGCTPIQKNEAIDHYLGRLQNDGVDVHNLAKEILGNPSSKPNGLHKSIVKLFKESSKLKIVTTNFDPHFSTVINHEFPRSNIETYYAPALPLGEQFSGLVYLHGSIYKNQSNLVLTDSDFGHAYLTSGWATRFLQGMFAEYTVLFIGYSLSDPLMTYLSRGLALYQKSKRYAFTTKDQETYWRSFGITAIPFPKQRGRRPYGVLPKALSRWVIQSKMGILDHTERIKQIVAGAPPLEIEIQDYLDFVINSPVLVRVFTRYASDIKWLEWISGKSVFEVLFKISDVTETSLYISKWIVDKYLVNSSDDIMTMIQKNYMVINHVLWNDIAEKLIDKEISTELAKKWVAILIRTFTIGCFKHLLERLLCKYKSDFDYLPLQLFEFLTRISLDLEPNFFATLNPEKTSSKVIPKISMAGEYYYLNDAWQNGLKENMQFFSKELGEILTLRIKSAYLLLKEFGLVGEFYDPLSKQRSAIEEHEQDRYPEDFDFIINASRDTLEWLLVHEPIVGKSLMDKWLQSKIPLLMRLAIHGMKYDETVSAEDKLLWVLDNKLLYAPGMKHEIFQLLESAYPCSNERSQTSFLKAIMQRSVGDFIETSEEIVAYERYNILNFVQSFDPTPKHVDQYISAIKKKYPVFIPRSHPDLDHYLSTGFIGDISPMSVKELIGNKPSDIAEFLLNYSGNSFEAASRSGLLANIGDAVSKDFQWCEKLISMLQSRREWKSDLWNALVKGLEKCTLDDQQWNVILRAIDNHGSPSNIADSVADLLLSSVRKENEKLPEKLFEVANKSAKKIFDEMTKSSPDTYTSKSIEKDYVTLSMNNLGGKITNFWLIGLSLKIKREGRSNGMPANYKEFFEQVLKLPQVEAKSGRVVLAGSVLFLYSIDSEWAVQKVLPLFDWKDHEQSKQAWEGYLYYGKWNESLLPYIIPLFEQTIPKLETDIPHLKDSFSRWIASLAVYSSMYPIPLLQKYDRQVSSHERCSLIKHVGRCLKSLEPEAVIEIWGRWLEKYLKKRIKGIPIAMTDDEIIATFRLIPSLEPVFETAVKLILKISAPNGKWYDLYLYFAEKKLAVKYSRTVANCLSYLLSKEDGTNIPLKELNDMTICLARNNVNQETLFSICDNLARWDHEMALKLREKITEDIEPKGRPTKN